MRHLRIGLCGDGAAAQALADRLDRTDVRVTWRDACLSARLPNVDACLIAGPIADRVETARVLVRVGTPVFLAWPPANDLRSLNKLAREADESGVAAWASLPLRFHSDLADLPPAPRLVTLECRGVRAPTSVASLSTMADLVLQLGRGYAPKRLLSTFVRTPTREPRAAAFSVRFDSGMLVHATAMAGGTPSIRLNAVSALTTHTYDLLASGAIARAEDAELAAFLSAAAERRPMRPGLTAARDALRLAAHVSKRAR